MPPENQPPSEEELENLAEAMKAHGQVTDPKTAGFLASFGNGILGFLEELRKGRPAPIPKKDEAPPDEDEEEDDDTDEEGDESEEGAPATGDGAVEGSGDKGEDTDEKSKKPPEPGYQDLQLGTDDVLDVEPLVKALLAQNELLAEQNGLLRQEQDERQAEVKSLRKALAGEKAVGRAALVAQEERLDQLQKSVDASNQMLGTVGVMVVNLTKGTADQLVEQSRTPAIPFTPAGPLNAVTGRHGGAAPAAPDIDRVVLSKALGARIITDSQLGKYKSSRVFSDDPAENTAILDSITKIS